MPNVFANGVTPTTPNSDVGFMPIYSLHTNMRVHSTNGVESNLKVRGPFSGAKRRKNFG